MKSHMYILALKKLTCWRTVSFGQLLVNSVLVEVNSAKRFRLDGRHTRNSNGRQMPKGFDRHTKVNPEPPWTTVTSHAQPLMLFASAGHRPPRVVPVTTPPERSAIRPSPRSASPPKLGTLPPGD